MTSQKKYRCRGCGEEFDASYLPGIEPSKRKHWRVGAEGNATPCCGPVEEIAEGTEKESERLTPEKLEREVNEILKTQADLQKAKELLADVQFVQEWLLEAGDCARQIIEVGDLYDGKKLCAMEEREDGSGWDEVAQAESLSLLGVQLAEAEEDAAFLEDE